MKEVKEYHQKQYGVDLSTKELAIMLNMEEGDIVLAMYSSHVSSLDQPMNDDPESDSLYSVLVSPCQDYENVLDKMSLKDAFSCLSEKEKLVIHYRYKRELTQSQIGKLLGISQVQISRIERRALNKMKVSME